MLQGGGVHISGRWGAHFVEMAWTYLWLIVLVVYCGQLGLVCRGKYPVNLHKVTL